MYKYSKEILDICHKQYVSAKEIYDLYYKLLNEKKNASDEKEIAYYEREANELRGYINDALWQLLEFADSYPTNKSIKIQYCEHWEIPHFGRSFGIEVTIDDFNVFLEYVQNRRYSQIMINFYHLFIGQRGEDFKHIMLKKKYMSSWIEGNFRRIDNHYIYPVTTEQMPQAMRDIVHYIESNQTDFIAMCRKSSSYNENGTHKFKSWTTTATVQITSESNTGVVQGFKDGERPQFYNHYTGGNGSFRVWDKITYGIELNIACISDELPISQKIFIDADEYLRKKKEEFNIGRNMPYAKLNAFLTKEIRVITKDMNLDPRERQFFPMDYNLDWRKVIDEAFKRMYTTE